MSTRKRSIGYYELKLIDKGVPTGEIEPLVEVFHKLEEMMPEETVKSFDKSDKAVGIESIEDKGHGYFWIAFKSARYGYRANLINKDDGSERENDKNLNEGEKELTHICIRIEGTVATCALESNREGVSISNITKYLEKMMDNGLSISYTIMATEGFRDIIAGSKRIISLNISFPGTDKCADNFRKEFPTNEEGTISIEFKPPRGKSISKKLALDIYDKDNDRDKKNSKDDNKDDEKERLEIPELSCYVG